LYNITMQLRLKGLLDSLALEKSLQEIVRRHEILRTRFAYKGDHPVQVIQENPKIALNGIDLTQFTHVEKEALVRKEAQHEAAEGFDLSIGPLLRCKLLKLEEREHVLLITMHHIVSDGWSMTIMVRELARLYEAFIAGKPAPLPELSIQYADFAVWQRKWLQGEVLEAQLNYWRRQLADIEPLELPTDRPRGAAVSHAGASERFTLSPELSEALNKLARREGVTLFMALLTAFQFLLSRYCRQKEIAVGAPIVGRRANELEGLIGFFVNMLVMKSDVSGEPTVSELLRRVRETTLGAYANQDVSFANVVEDLQPERSLNRHPLFHVVFALQNLPQKPVNVPGLEISHLESGAPIAAKFDLMLTAQWSGSALSGALLYRPELYEAGA